MAYFSLIFLHPSTAEALGLFVGYPSWSQIIAQ